MTEHDLIRSINANGISVRWISEPGIFLDQKFYRACVLKFEKLETFLEHFIKLKKEQYYDHHFTLYIRPYEYEDGRFMYDFKKYTHMKCFIFQTNKIISLGNKSSTLQERKI